MISPTHTHTHSSGAISVRDSGRTVQAISLLAKRAAIRSCENASEPHNVITFNAVISACEEVSQMYKTLELLAWMQRQPFLSHAIIFYAAISTWQRAAIRTRLSTYLLECGAKLFHPTSSATQASALGKGLPDPQGSRPTYLGAARSLFIQRHISVCVWCDGTSVHTVTFTSVQTESHGYFSPPLRSFV